MRKWLRHVEGVLFDGGCIFVGGLAAVWARSASSGETFGEKWLLRLALTALPAALLALVSTYLRQDVAWRSWLRFALFELVAVLLVLGEWYFNWGWDLSPDFASKVDMLLPRLVDAAIYAVGLNVWRLERRGETPA